MGLFRFVVGFLLLCFGFYLGSSAGHDDACRKLFAPTANVSWLGNKCVATNTTILTLEKQP